MTTDTVGGVWVYALELTRALLRRGHQVALAAMGRRLSTDQRREIVRCRGLQVYESDYKLEWMEDPWTDVERAGDWLLGLEAELAPDVIHLNGYTHGALPWSAPVLIVGHSCVLSWFQAVRGEEAPAQWKKYRVKVTRGLQNADVVIAPSEAMSRALDEHYGPFTSTRVIYNGRKPRRGARREKENFIFAAGRLWDSAKNIGALASVADQVSWPVYIAGDQKPPCGCVPEFNVPGGVQHLGRLSSAAMADWYSRAAIYALPARYEPFGLSVLEAALNGCALLLGDIPSLQELWGDCALHVDPGQPDELARALNLLIKDFELRETLGARAKRHARKFNVDVMAERYLDVYDELCNRRHAGARALESIRMPTGSNSESTSFASA
jgi:glycogen synthase